MHTNAAPDATPRLSALPYVAARWHAQRVFDDAAWYAGLPLSAALRCAPANATLPRHIHRTVIAGALFATVRTSAARWASLRDLTVMLDRLVRANLQMDLLSTKDARTKISRAATFEQDLDRLTRRLQREITRLQVDRLTLDLRLKKKRDGRS